jgi:hypothetical protein
MTRSCAPDDDPSPPQRRWWPLAVAAMAAPARARAGRGRRSKTEAVESAARQPACCGRQPVPAVTEGWPSWRIDQLVVCCWRRHQLDPSASNSEVARASRNPAAGGRRPRRQLAQGSAVWPSPGPPPPRHSGRWPLSPLGRWPAQATGSPPCHQQLPLVTLALTERLGDAKVGHLHRAVWAGSTRGCSSPRGS